LTSDRKTLFLTIFICNRLKRPVVKKQIVGKPCKLTRLGFLQGLLEGSAEYTRLLAAAAAEYQQTQAAARVSKEQYSPAKRMEEVMKLSATAAGKTASLSPIVKSSGTLVHEVRP
jgi:hypothetical protein